MDWKIKTTDSRVFLSSYKDKTKFKLKMSEREGDILEKNCCTTEAVAEWQSALETHF